MSAERSAERIQVVGISGPTGAGKNYLTTAASNELGLSRVTMLTTRSARSPDQEDKHPISLDEFKSYKPEDLVGTHQDPKTEIWYAYRVSDLNAGGRSIIELSPMQQTEFAEEVRDLGIEFAGWVGLVADIDYLKHNVQQREQMPEDQVVIRMQRSQEFMDRLRELHKQGIVTVLFEVGWHNRETMGDEFTSLIKGILDEKK